MIDEVFKGLVFTYLFSIPTDDEIKTVYEECKRKQQRIINAGITNEYTKSDFYLAMLVAEKIRDLRIYKKGVVTIEG